MRSMVTDNMKEREHYGARADSPLSLSKGPARLVKLLERPRRPRSI